MIADDYFQVRAQLGTALFSLQTLSHELHASHETGRALQELSASLREPFVFVAIGDERSGKSSLLNALFGRELCRVGGEAAPHVHVFCYGPREKDVVSGNHLDCFRPVFLLRDFQIVDTPGVSRLRSVAPGFLREFLPSADLILCVFPATDPWKSAALGYLSELDKETLQRVVLVVQQADLRKRVELDAITAHLRQTAREIAGRDFPVFAVSAADAFLAKTSAFDKDRLLSESGMDRLEHFIDEAVARGERRWGKLGAVCATAQRILEELGVRAREEFETVIAHEQKLSELSLTLEDRRQLSLQQVNGVLWTLTQSYDRAQKRGAASLAQQLSWRAIFQTLLRRGKWRGQFDDTLEPRLTKTVRRHIASAIDALEEDLRGLWSELRASLESTFSSELGVEPESPAFIEERAELLQKVDATLQDRTAGGVMKQGIESFVARASGWLMYPVIATIAGALIALSAVVVASIGVAAIAGGLALLAAFCALGLALYERDETQARFVSYMVRRREDLLTQIEDHLRHAIDVYHRELHAQFEPLRALVAAQRTVCEPMLARVAQLEETFANTAADLGIARRP